MASKELFDGKWHHAMKYEVSIYNRALTDVECEALARGADPRTIRSLVSFDGDFYERDAQEG